MNLRATRRRTALTGLLVLAACSSAPPQATQQATLQAASPAPRSAAVAPSPQAPAEVGNELRVLVFRGGSAARFGHNHVLLAGDLRVDWAAGGPVLRFRLDELTIDPPEIRERLGPAFASLLDDQARAGTRANLMKALDAEAHPEVVVRTLQQVGEGDRRAVEAEISWHGLTRRQWLVVAVDGRHARGEAVLRQSDFGIVPFTVLGGLLAVQDALVVQFELTQP
ncbi:MAG: YceI family protein [Burkholderiales bacterium]|uniref:YceI family protein n=1 Tax=Roseateles sp. TaxID=1971397 RepID=UPI000FB66D8F|nr:MAG: YceI family protein [Burkholderiales bacterium]